MFFRLTPAMAVASGVLFAAATAEADVIFNLGVVPFANSENLVLPIGGSGASLTGVGGATGGQAVFSAAETLATGAQSGQFVPSDGSLAGFMIDSVGGNAFTGFLFDLNAITDAMVHVSVEETNGNISNFDYFADGNGQNPLTITATFGTIDSITVSLLTGSGISAVSGLRAAFAGAPPPTPVPEPGVWALMVLGFGGLGAALRGRRTARA